MKDDFLSNNSRNLYNCITFMPPLLRPAWINNYPFYVRYTELVIRLVNKTLNTVLTSIVLFLKLSPLGLESKSSGLGLALEPRRRVLAPGPLPGSPLLPGLSDLSRMAVPAASLLLTPAVTGVTAGGPGDCCPGGDHH